MRMILYLSGGNGAESHAVDTFFRFRMEKVLDFSCRLC